MNVAVVMGGYSDESVISLRSGQLILNNLDKSKYNIFEVHILLKDWSVVIEGEKYPINKADFSFTKNGVITKFDVAINTVHGTPGEDGHLQSYWELIDIPYTGCNFYQSALTFNKRDTLSVLTKFNIPKAKSIYLRKGDVIDGNEIKKALGLPFFVKPNQSGSSLGVSKVDALDQLEKALEFAFAEDNEILIESYLNGTEVSVGVLNYKGQTKVLGITEILSQNDFFDYEAKYLGKSEEITPARISKEEEILVAESAKKIYNSLGMSGFSRTDFIIMNGIPHFIEINTNPGLSPQSIFPQQAMFAKMDMPQMLDNEITLALSRKPIWKK
ncbi:D-alanine--D-alanine ligase [Flavobacterium psychrophilum]|uniref:D-alanine--D-alanine ligase n=1 Tax=Flavobacterium psychrophilum (strain ATCC 49511 / DSM 21280 / CIP 103535 / JIP02/86) TaxID=402612 RepID=DDL_FLAPJ|nr:D-alanine--D-alanine ligase [Flavobacterium psychrophilum]A6GXD5.1 RecName: Full=D-alanine--D-alanine ligase; AltName: Full=D-Ala-D-Ala ligase; AltName: Full=D-alanylalanine synthetase [Flavobacterium psychrophilum JIP02/86]AIG29552.1 D-alanine--D-alanine ligase [Flavobacterium psychrophilum]AIG31829.1 D-alanine--D-alanine ligase [Flavobacterium psychrophilum]AIG33983.1 D-alanine--D-alanine ligase [Flavobacterium psychrophilum]AIG36346.1 D-alanine--D-alanine ligase [Flavobacterium psychroph